jgi:hypothetical protein
MLQGQGTKAATPQSQGVRPLTQHILRRNPVGRLVFNRRRVRTPVKIEAASLSQQRDKRRRAPNLKGRTPLRAARGIRAPPAAIAPKQDKKKRCQNGRKANSKKIQDNRTQRKEKKKKTSGKQIKKIKSLDKE